MTEEIINCDFYNDKICNLFTEYFKFKVECKNLSLCTVDDDTEKECPYKQLKRLEQENKELKKANEISIEKVTVTAEAKRLQELEQENKELRYKIQEVVQANDRIVAECTEIMKPKCETSMISELMKENETLTKENENRNNWITSLNKKCEELIKEKLNYRSALEEIREYCNRIERGEVIGTQDCLINSIKNIVNYTINEN